MGITNQISMAPAEDSSPSKAPLIISLGLMILCLASIGYDPRFGVAVTWGLLALALLLARMQWLVYAIVAVVVLLVDGWTLTRSPDDVMFRIGIGRLYLMEIPIYLLVVGYAWRCWMNKASSKDSLSPRTPLDRPLYAWLLAFVIFAVYGVHLGNPLQDAAGYYEWRCLLLGILLYFLVAGLFQDDRDRMRLFWWFFGLATVKAAYSLFLLLSHIDPPLPMIFGSGPLGEGPENVMYVFAALPAVAFVVFRLEKNAPRRAWVRLGLLALVANVVLSAKRDPQLGLAIGCAVIGWRLPLREKVRWGASLAAVVLAVFLLGAVTSGRPRESDSSPFRYKEIVDFISSPGENTNPGDTFAFHVFDLVDGWNAIMQRPFLGYGFGGQTQRELTLLSFTGGDEVATGVVHNQYLTFWLKMGIAGPGLFLWVVVSFLRSTHRAVRGAPQTFPAAIALGFAAAIWGDLAMEFWTTDWIANTKTPLVVFLGLALAIGFLGQKTQEAAAGS